MEKTDRQGRRRNGAFKSSEDEVLGWDRNIRRSGSSFSRTKRNASKAERNF